MNRYSVLAGLYLVGCYAASAAVVVAGGFLAHVGWSLA